jgi:putative peptidoglycan lipid II flippase
MAALMAADRFEKNARTFTLLTLLSRATGLLRDATLARAFGVGPVMDAFSFGFMVPNLFRRLFGEGAMSAAFLPIYARLDRDDPLRARAFA